VDQSYRRKHTDETDWYDPGDGNWVEATWTATNTA
jgi:hypothetical protein